MGTQKTKKSIMDYLTLDARTVALFRKFLEHPERYEGCDYKPIRECFEESDTCTPQHILYNEYIAYLRRPLPKVFFYIIMAEIFPELTGYAEVVRNERGEFVRGGEFGYYLRCTVKPETT